MVVKICANKTIGEAEMCLVAGADMIGVLVGQGHNSSDFIDKQTAKEINDYINGRCPVVLVTHLKYAKDIIELTNYIGNSFIQLHSDIDESEVKKICIALPNVKIIRVIHISKSGEILTNIKDIKYANFYLLDSINKREDKIGGTGCVHNWETSKKLVETLNKPVFLAGGLTPNNVQEAISKVHPYGVDVNTGCKLNGKKNAYKVKLFVKNAKK